MLCSPVASLVVEMRVSVDQEGTCRWLIVQKLARIERKKRSETIKSINHDLQDQTRPCFVHNPILYPDLSPVE